MVLRVRDAQKNPDRDQLLDAIREWETARRMGAFSASQRERLKNPKSEFHLEKIADQEWRLYPFHYSNQFTHEKKDLQPGEPTTQVGILLILMMRSLYNLHLKLLARVEAL